MKSQVKLSADFKKSTRKAILSIVFFAFVYLALLVLAVGLTVLCAYAGLLLVITVPRLITLGLGVGLASMGVLIFVFLIKFMFTRNKVDRSHLIEITRAQEPELFKMIDDIVNEVQTKFPKKVYLSANVNASVFYDSSFWSMFFPVQKNLNIGLGLVNSVTREELKAILSHEFGHFSQRTMKVGSYVYNVNQVIFNMLFDNNSYGRMIEKWAATSGYIAIFVMIAAQIVGGIQWVLQKMYAVVNKSYFGLSREMEFHADEIAASVTGYEPLQSSLLRLSIADEAFNELLAFYNSPESKEIRTRNFYPEHTYVMNYMAAEKKIPMKNNLPEITIDEVNKFNKSKLVIKNQWASHPSMEDRIERIRKTGYTAKNSSNLPASDIFKKLTEQQEKITTQMFVTPVKDVEYTFLTPEQFVVEFQKDLSKSMFPKIYNGYYDYKDPLTFEIPEICELPILSLDTLFSLEKVDLVNESMALTNDLETIKQISQKKLPIKTFDYDGQKYERKDAKELLVKLTSEQKALNLQVQENDQAIFCYFKNLELKKGVSAKLKELYERFFAYNQSFDTKVERIESMFEKLQFVSRDLTPDAIIEHLKSVGSTETALRSEMRQVIDIPELLPIITTEIKESIEQYLSKKWHYFNGATYDNNALQLLSAALNNYNYLLSRGFFVLKKELLDYQEQLESFNS